MSPSPDEVLDALRAYRFSYWSEDALQVAIADALVAAGFEPVREVRLGRRDRIDLMVGSVGIEVKVAGTVGDVRRQVARYMESDEIDAVILVTNRVRHSLPAEIRGKSVRVLMLTGAGL